MTKKQKIDALTRKLAEVNATLTVTESDLRRKTDEAETLKGRLKRSEDGREKSDKDLREFRKKISDALNPPVKATLTFSPNSGLGSIPVIGMGGDGKAGSSYPFISG